MVQLFETNTYSVVNIFDVTLRPQLNATAALEVTDQPLWLTVPPLSLSLILPSSEFSRYQKEMAPE